MSPRGFAPSKVDANQRVIVEALRADGHFVTSLAKVGHGVPDLLVCTRLAHMLVLIEVKIPGEGLNEREETWHALFPGRAYIVRTVAEARYTANSVDEAQMDLINRGAEK